MKKIISTTNAPSAIGPYSQATIANGIMFISGQLPLDPKTGEFAGDDIKTQTAQCLSNIKSIVEAAGADMSAVLKTTVLLQNMSDFAAMNEVYATFFSGDFPARAAYEVAKLPRGAMIEIEAIAAV